MRLDARLMMAGLAVVILVVMFAGCSGSNDQTVFQNISERSTWRPDGSRLAFASPGGNGILYVYSINARGGGLTLLTPTTDNNDDTDEGGRQPSWSPNGVDIAMVARRGGGSQSLYLMDPVQGSRTRETRLTDNALQGADAQPSWSADSTRLVYVSTKSGVGHYTIWTVNRDGTGAAQLFDPGDDAQWPVFSPDGTKIAFQLGVGRAGVDTDTLVLDVAALTTTNLTGPNGFRDDAPNWSPDGTTLAFFSNRRGDFDVWLMNADGTNARAIATTPVPEGYPVWNPTGTRLAFTRDLELWTMMPDGTDQNQVTKQFRQ